MSYVPLFRFLVFVEGLFLVFGLVFGLFEFSKYFKIYLKSYVGYIFFILLKLSTIKVFGIFFFFLSFFF